MVCMGPKTSRLVMHRTLMDIGLLLTNEKVNEQSRGTTFRCLSRSQSGHTTARERNKKSTLYFKLRQQHTTKYYTSSFTNMCSKERKKTQSPDCSYNSDSIDGEPSPTERVNRGADLESLRERGASILDRMEDTEQEIRRLNAEAARIRAARREYIKIWKARKTAAEAGNSNDQPPPAGKPTA